MAIILIVISQKKIKDFIKKNNGICFSHGLLILDSSE